MLARTILFSFLLHCYITIGQEVSLPADLRQHALTQYNASLFNPTFSLEYNNPQSISFWTRWQWQQIDADPTTLFLNYSRSINEKSSFAGGFFQHNTGTYFNTGGVANYAYEIRLNPIIKLAVGVNLFGFQQQLADKRFLPNPDITPFPIDFSDDFIFQLAPGFNLSIENFSLSMASENLFDYNLTDKEANTETSDKIFMGMASYNFPVMASDSTAFLRPSFYLRTIPKEDNQIGLNVLFSTQKYWAQAGYNNFYGISAGVGATFFNRISLGVLVEYGINSSLNSKDASFEILASYFLGKPENRRKAVLNAFDDLESKVTRFDEEEKMVKMQEELDKAQRMASDEKKKQKPKSIQDKPNATKELPETDRQLRVNKKEAKKQVSKERALSKKRIKDSLQRLQELREVPQEINETAVAKTEPSKEEVKLQAGERYEEVRTEGGLDPGFYLIANVFGTKKYFDAFMQGLRAKGLNPGFFQRTTNNYNYAYLKRYATIGEARSARDSNFDGKYQGKTWIFRVVGE